MKLMKKHSEIFGKAIDRLQAMHDCNHEVMDADDLGDLMTTIKELQYLKTKAVAIEYREQVRDFLNYLNDGPATIDEDEWQTWSQTPFTISHGDKQVLIDNCADVYEGFVALLKDHLEDISE